MPEQSFAVAAILVFLLDTMAESCKPGKLTKPAEKGFGRETKADNSPAVAACAMTECSSTMFYAAAFDVSVVPVSAASTIPAILTAAMESDDDEADDGKPFDLQLA